MEQEVKYRICFLGYRNLTDLARSALESLQLQDTEVRLEDCNVETLQQTVDQAAADGFEIFIAGSANAAEFRRHYKLHLVEIHLRPVDYLTAIQKALQIGSRPCLALYRFGRPVDLPLLEKLAGISLETISYEDSAQLMEGIRSAQGDVILGGGHATELAEECGKKSVLLYPGEDSIRSAIRRARALAAELEREMHRSRIVQSIIGDAPIGLIVTDVDGNITVCNRAARSYAMLGSARVLRKPLAEVLPPLAPEEFLRSGEKQLDQRKLVNGAMMRCVHVRIQDRDQLIGVLTTIYPDNTRRSKEEQEIAERFRVHASWEDVIGDSPAVQRLLQEAKAVADSDQPLVILGESGTGKTFYARCIHNASARRKSPCITVNAASLPDQELSRVLLGTEEGDTIRPGLLELAGNGTIILRGLSLASKIVQNALLQTFDDRSFLRLGGMTPVPFRARVITILDAETGGSLEEASAGINEPLRYLLSVLTLRIPPLRERREDIPAMFEFYALQASEAVPGERRKAPKVSAEVLRYYSWPGNLFELNAVCKRYIFLLSKEVRLTPASRHLLLLQSIGEEKILSEILGRHPALLEIGKYSGKQNAKAGHKKSGSRTEAAAADNTADLTIEQSDPANNAASADDRKKSHPIDDIIAGIEDMKRILKYNNDTIAQKLSISRTTLWRITKEV